MGDEATKPVQVDETRTLSTDEGGGAAEVEETKTVEDGEPEQEDEPKED